MSKQKPFGNIPYTQASYGYGQCYGQQAGMPPMLTKPIQQQQQRSKNYPFPTRQHNPGINNKKLVISCRCNKSAS